MAEREETMVERITHAIAERRRQAEQKRANDSGHDVMFAIDGYLPEARLDAVEALNAMLYPNDEMIAAGDAALADRETPIGRLATLTTPAHSAYSHMIRGALKEATNA